MATILLHEPVVTSSQLERLHLFPGRHLGEDEFDRLQAYADARLEPLLAGHRAGILGGLEVTPDLTPDTGNPLQPYRLGEGFTVAPGMAVAGNGQALGLYYPIRETWDALIEAYLEKTRSTNPAGVYFLTLTRSRFEIDAARNVDPCQRTELDPTRDSRMVVLGSVALRKLAIPASAVEDKTREQIENVVAANCADGRFLANLGHAVPLGLLAVEAVEDGYEPAWFSPIVGRYLAQPDSGYRVLLEQINDAFRRRLNEAQRAGENLVDYLDDNLSLDYLPAAGQLPLALLQDPAGEARIAWLPPHLRVDAVPVPDTVVADLVERNISRRVVDLTRVAGDRIRLLLAVPERDYRPNLLDVPKIDDRLAEDLYRYYMRAYDSWAAYRSQFDRLYYPHTGAGIPLPDEQVEALSLPQPVEQPVLPGRVIDDVIERAKQELGEPVPYPYDDRPLLPGFFTRWLQGGNPPDVEPPEEDGLVVQYAVGKVDLEALDNQIRMLRVRLGKTQDYLLLQRQQLDAQTVSLATLAGGVAGDGSGLQIARWMPYAKFSAPTEIAAESGSATESATRVEAMTGAASTAFAPLTMMPLTFSATSAFTPTTTTTTKTVSAAITPTIGISRLKPATRSAIEFGIDKQRLEQLNAVPKQPLTPPAIDTKPPARVGVLSHVEPDLHAYKKVHEEMEGLMSSLDGLFDKKEAAGIKGRLQKIWTTVGLKHPSQIDENIVGPARTEHRYSELFKAGQVLTQQIAIIESRYDKLERDLQAKLRERVQLEEQLAKLAARIVEERQKFDTLDAQRVERMGDYAVAQRLLEEDWRGTFQRNEARSKLLTTGLTGLYYVRVNTGAVSMPLADPLELRHGGAGDLVPGCPPDTDVELPEDLHEFFDTVLELPAADLAALSGLLPKVAQSTRLELLRDLRRQRLEQRILRPPVAVARPTLQLALGSLKQQNIAILDSFAGRKWDTTTVISARERSRVVAETLSLQDLATGGSGSLRREAQQLQSRLEQCIGCLIEQLDKLSPSIRLEWSQLAEDDRLATDAGFWPGLELAERDDFNAVRTLVELVQWWYRQLAPNASAAGKTAMRNMIRAAVIRAALGDPAEILHGQVQVPPRRLAIGETLRLALNKPPKIGTTLQLLDRQQRVIGLVSVADQDDKGVVASLVQIDRPTVTVNTGFTVVAGKLTGMLGR